MTWQESWCHSSQSGFRKQHDTFDAWYPLALLVENSLLNTDSLHGVFLDYEKAFDLLPLHEIILPLARHLGLPGFFVNCLSNFYSRLVRYFKHPKGFGSAIKSDRGIVQGCPISVVLLNLLVSVFLRYTENTNSLVMPQAYADDVSASSHSIPGISQFLDQAGTFAKVTGQRLKASKCQLWTTNETLKAELQLLKLGSTQLPVVKDVRYLGAQFGFHPGIPHVLWEDKLQRFAELVRRAGSLPLPAEAKAEIIAACPIAKLFHGCELTTLCVESLKKLRTQVLASLWDGRSSRVPEVLTTIVFKGHRCDPLQVVAYKALNTFRALCLKNNAVFQLMSQNWSLHVDQHDPNVWGPTHTVLLAVQFVGWSWYSFDHFDRPDWPSLHWTKCSKTWFSHQVREALRQSQILIASKRCAHLRDFTFLDKFSSVKLLRHLLASKKPYLAGTLKAILANAIKTAVVFHKAGMADGPTCPFCSMDVPETNHHLFNVCPGWADIRTKRNHSASLDLPHCTQCTGVACLPPSTLTILKELAQTSVVLPDHTNFFSEVFPAFESVSNDVLSIWLCTHMMHPGHPYWKRCGFALIFDEACSHPHTCVDQLSGPDQAEIRAFALGLIYVLSRIPRAVKIHVSCPQYLKFWNDLCNPNISLYQFDHHDLVLPIRNFLGSRPWVDLICLVPSNNPSAEIKAASDAARRGAELHRSHTYDLAFTHYCKHQQLVVDRQQCMIDILIARDEYAQKNKLLSYSPTSKRVPFSDNSVANFDKFIPDSQAEYLVHPDNFDGHCHKLGPFPHYSRSLRYAWDDRFFHALVWYLQQLRFPENSINTTKGVSYLELAMDFELSTGIILPGSSKRMKKKDGAVQRRGASMRVSFVHDPPEVFDNKFIAHSIIKTDAAPRKPRFLGTACQRSGNWAERSRFLKYSCAGKPETKSEAMRRHRIQQEQLKRNGNVLRDVTPIPLGERALVFADAFRSTLRHDRSQFHPLEHATSVCRALKGHSLPPTAGLLVRPILLCQSTISDEIARAARSFHTGEWDHTSHWHSTWFPAFDKPELRPEPLWRPREPD